MPAWRRRIVYSVTFVVLLVVLLTLLYRWTMATVEGVDVTILESTQVVVEALTTAGFGSHTDDWNSAVTYLIVIGMNLTGVLLVFLALPLFVVPLFQQALEASPRTATDLTGHVVVCSYNTREDVLRTELETAEVPYVIVDSDPETVMELNDSGFEAICGDPEQEQTFQAANVGAAEAVVVDVSTERNVSVILTVRELDEEVTVVSVAENQQDAEYQRYAGADRVIRPREALGRALARKVTASVTHELQETITLGEDFELSELVVKENSDLAGKTLAEAELRNEIGATVIGVWSNGEFVPVPDPDLRIDENTILLVAGSHQTLEAVTSQTSSPKLSGTQRVVVVGYGVVGRTAADLFGDDGLSPTVVDMVDDDEVDVTGNVNDRETLSDADVENARFVVLALDDDTTTMYTTVALEELAPDTEVLARANEVENTKKLYRAGAEYVLSLSTVTGRMLSSVLLEDEEVLTPDTQFEIVRTPAPGLVGKTLAEAAVRNETGATVVAIERDGALVTTPGPESTVHEDDILIVAGDDTAVNAFTSRFS